MGTVRVRDIQKLLDNSWTGEDVVDSFMELLHSSQEEVRSFIMPTWFSTVAISHANEMWIRMSNWRMLRETSVAEEHLTLFTPTCCTHTKHT